MANFEIDRVHFQFRDDTDLVKSAATLSELPLVAVDDRWQVAPGWLVHFDMSGVEPDWDRGKRSHYMACPAGHFPPRKFAVAHVIRL